MTERERPLTDEELGEQTGEELPDREAMSLVNANVAVPVNLALAANVLSDDAVAYAAAAQDAANVNEKSARTTVSSRQRTEREGGRK